MIRENEGVFEIVSINLSEKTGIRKKPVDHARFILGEGIAGDAHAGLLEKRQVSLLAVEEIEAASAIARTKLGLKAAVATLKPGDFAENLTTRGIALHELPIGTKLEIGSALLEVSQIGKECHAACEIRKLVGDCAMPRKGVFARVLREGEAFRADSCRYSF
ncbi:MAG: MOSC domain-containing protein [Treponemataceae bacterium]